jgi:haloacetate dehalogenase
VFESFAEAQIATAGTNIFVRHGGEGPPLLLLHGFPQTHLMWRDIASRLTSRFTVVAPDLRGYGRSGCPPSARDHAPYSKRAMANDMVEVMGALGFERFAVAGHDRGGRVAYRLALDHPQRVDRFAVLDVLPGGTMWDRADARLALAFWPWSLLAQPEPLPERLVGGAPEAVVDDALTQWDSHPSAFPVEVREAYVDALRDADRVHAICEEYRAAAGIDREHDDADRRAGRRITCPVLALWSAKGGLEHWSRDQGGPLELWREWASEVSGHAVDGGHFFPEEKPEEIAEALGRFFAGIALALERV